VRTFQKAGWVKDRQHASHVIPIKPGHPASLSVPQHRELAPGTLRALIRASGMSFEGGQLSSAPDTARLVPVDSVRRT
jgi:predicted RNA binding protein YcfA (HicA-like mRNA interferase family)